jgi:hypothetical protein
MWYPVPNPRCRKVLPSFDDRQHFRRPKVLPGLLSFLKLKLRANVTLLVMLLDAPLSSRNLTEVLGVSVCRSNGVAVDSVRYH